MKRLKITGCTDSLLWYAEKIGEIVPYVSTSESEEFYMSREPAGYLNIVYMKDAELLGEEHKMSQPLQNWGVESIKPGGKIPICCKSTKGCSLHVPCTECQIKINQAAKGCEGCEE